MSEKRILGVSISVMCKTEEEMLKAGEVLNRAAAGLAMEGFATGVNYTNIPDEEEDVLGGHPDPRYEM